MKLNSVLDQNLLNDSRQFRERMKMPWAGWLDAVRLVALHENNSAIPRMLRDNLSASLGDVIRPKPNPQLNHLFVVSRLPAVLFM